MSLLSSNIALMARVKVIALPNGRRVQHRNTGPGTCYQAATINFGASINLLLCSFALDKAYDLLATKAADDQEAGICFADFLMFMYYYQPYTRTCTLTVQYTCTCRSDPLLYIMPRIISPRYAAEWQVMCIFKALLNDLDSNKEHPLLTKDEFHRLYEVRDLKWKHVSSTQLR